MIVIKGIGQVGGLYGSNFVTVELLKTFLVKVDRPGSTTILHSYGEPQ